MISLERVASEPILGNADTQQYLNDLLTLTHFWEDGVLSDDEFVMLKARLPRRRRRSSAALFDNSFAPVD